MYIHVGRSAFADCTNGEVRLVGGATLLEGRVEVCINHAWGGVCDNSWSSASASIVCGQLGFQRAGKSYVLSYTMTCHAFPLVAAIFVACNNLLSDC